MDISCRHLLLLFLSFLLFNTGCIGEKGASAMFQIRTPDQTGIDFANTITVSDNFNVQNYPFIYNGAGVAIGDINNDGLSDIFFTGNMVSSRLYLNRGDMQFENITEQAGVTTQKWATGATMVDINNDGYLDIYVSFSGPEWSEPEERRNELFLNNGDQTFTEAAAGYRIDDTGFTTHALFFDYDRDGDLDLFLLNNSPDEFARGETGSNPVGQRTTNPASFDRLYRNNGDSTFTDVSAKTGILQQLGYGLGAVVSDLNGDGWPDLYVSNDITPNDVLYVNNRDGTFTDKASEWLRHTSFAGMGIDIADFTNNGWPDILQTDMMPADLGSRKRMSGATTYGMFMDLRRRGYYPHYNINTLQMNQGVSETGEVIFGEIGRMAGVAYTHWSWSALFGDYDNDGFKDIFITNGYPKAVNDFDYLTDMNRARMFGEDEQVKQRELEILEELHSYELSNYIFRNEGEGPEGGHSLRFSDQTGAWGMDQPGFSYGAAYADLNNNGRLDMVVNNIDAPAFIYENIGIEDRPAHYLQVRLKGESPNVRGIGTKLILTAGVKKQYIYHTPYRGFMSTMDDRIHFGLGESGRIDTLEVIWPDGRSQILTELDANRLLTVEQVEAKERDLENPTSAPGRKLFRAAVSDHNLRYKHEEKSSPDFHVQSLLPHQVSRLGPPLAVADIDGNGLDDVFIGGVSGVAGRLFLQQNNGRFVESTHSNPWEADREQEDWGACFFDANGDGLPDLYVASGGYHSSPVSDLLQDRLYINQGDGRFVRDDGALPRMLTSTARVTAGDFTGDGRPDLFVGGRLTPRNYPQPARSYLLRNDGGGFTDVTEDVAPGLVDPGGMITDAEWVDFTGDGRPDLVTTGEWMPVQFYENTGDKLTNVTESADLPPMRGWWYSLEQGDFNNDGHIDLIAGNLGLNHTFTTSGQEKTGVYATDLTGNLNTHLIFTREINGREYPVEGLAKLGSDIYTIELKFPSFEAFSMATAEQVMGTENMREALYYQADTFSSVHLQNNGDGTFTDNDLPAIAQLSPIMDILADDMDGDGYIDLLVAGNLYQTEPNIPRVDAGSGLWMKGDGDGGFYPVSPTESGFLAPLDARGLALINTPGGKAVLVANNGDSLQVFEVGRR